MTTSFAAKFAKLADFTLTRRLALALRNGLEYRNTDWRGNSCNNSSTSCENMVSTGPVTPEFTRLNCVYQGSE